MVWPIDTYIGRSRKGTRLTSNYTGANTATKESQLGLRARPRSQNGQTPKRNQEEGEDAEVTHKQDVAVLDHIRRVRLYHIRIAQYDL